MKVATTIVKQEVRPMRLEDYGRNPAKRKEYVRQERLLLVGIDKEPMVRLGRKTRIGPYEDRVGATKSEASPLDFFRLFQKRKLASFSKNDTGPVCLNKKRLAFSIEH